MDWIYNLGALPNIYSMVTTLDNFLIHLHLLNVRTWEMNNCLACLRYGDEFYFPFQALLVWIKIQERDFDTSSNIFIVLAELMIFVGLKHILAWCLFNLWVQQCILKCIVQCRVQCMVCQVVPRTQPLLYKYLWKYVIKKPNQIVLKLTN